MVKLTYKRVSVFIDGTPAPGNPHTIASYINHSCNPNCVVEPIVYQRTLMACVMTTRPIAAQEFLTLDYGPEFEGIGMCRCGAENCRDRDSYMGANRDTPVTVFFP